MYDVEDWAQIPEFPDYYVSTFGEVMNFETKRILKPSYTSRGALKVGLISGGRQHARVLKLLVARAFVYGETDIFDTPINLDGNPHNNCVDNLVWRPRWFALKYTRQFKETYSNEVRGPIKDLDSGTIYTTVRDASIDNGLLFKEVFASCLSGEVVAPTWQAFEWIR
jgi:hypothetical protein